MDDSYDRVRRLVSGRRAGTVTLKQLATEIESFSNHELAELAARLLQGRTGRKHLRRDLLEYAQRMRVRPQGH